MGIAARLGRLELCPSRARIGRRSFWHDWRVDDQEARRILDDVTAELRRESYGTLVTRYVHESDTRTVVAESGVQYQVEVQAFWDGRQPGNLRVVVAIDDGGWRAFKPLSTDFIVASDGSFVGE